MISIIIPVYNVEKYLHDNIVSIENQTYRDFEVIFVDDGSTDNSREIIENHMRQGLCSFRLITQENSGVSVARNRGLAEAQGDFICFVDSDDILDSRYLEVLYENITRYDVDVSIVGKGDIDEYATAYVCPQTESKSEKCAKEEGLERLLQSDIKSGIWGLLVRREVIADLRFAEGYAYSEDLEMVWRLVASSESVAVTDEPLYGYRLRRGSAMSKINDRRVDGLRLFQQLEGFIAQKAPAFLARYQKYGVAKWLWATLWQEAFAFDKYRDFKESIKKYGDLSVMKNLKSFPKRKVRLSSRVFCFSPRLYFTFMKLLRRKYRTFEKKE